MPVWKLFLITYKSQLIFVTFLIIAFIVIHINVGIYLRRSQEKKIRKRGYSTDVMTGLYNSTAFKELVQNHLVTVSDFSSDALILIDVDNMKDYNKENGTFGGDNMLKRLSDILRQGFRSSDIIARIQGDKFAVYLKNIHTPDFLKRKATELFQSTKMTNSDTENQVYPFSISAGITCVKTREVFSDTFKRAEEALQIAKENGRKQFFIL